MSLSADETMLATAGPNGVRLWDVATGAARGRVGDGSAVGAVAFSPAAPLVAIVVAGYPEPGRASRSRRGLERDPALAGHEAATRCCRRT